MVEKGFSIDIVLVQTPGLKMEEESAKENLLNSESATDLRAWVSKYVADVFNNYWARLSYDIKNFPDLAESYQL